jgi:UDP-N-acetylglucosamine 1-carboxyvinyltransferase
VFDVVTGHGTENLLMAATLAEGTTTLEKRCARARSRRSRAVSRWQWARTSPGAGTDRIVIEASSALHGATHAVMPDRIETGTYLAAVVAAGGDATIRGTQADTLEAILGKLAEAGRRVTVTDDAIASCGESRCSRSTCARRRFPRFRRHAGADDGGCDARRRHVGHHRDDLRNRMMHVQELVRLGAEIEVEGNTAIVRGVDKLTGAT